VQAGDRIVRIAGQTMKPKDIPAHIRATQGKPFRLIVLRNGKRVVLGPLRAKEDNGAYRIGIAIEARTGPGESPPAAIRDASKLTWDITAETVRGIGHLATGRDTDQVSSSVGIVRVSAQAWRQGARDFLFVLGLVSLAFGLLNLLPVLPLDGGHIVMALVEKVRGRTFRQAVYVRYSVVGLTLFAVLMYFGLRNDLFGGGG
jgi:regulator of sigma E protease